MIDNLTGDRTARRRAGQPTRPARRGRRAATSGTTSRTAARWSSSRSDLHDRRPATPAGSRRQVPQAGTRLAPGGVFTPFEQDAHDLGAVTGGLAGRWPAAAQRDAHDRVMEQPRPPAPPEALADTERRLAALGQPHPAELPRVPGRAGRRPAGEEHVLVRAARPPPVEQHLHVPRRRAGAGRRPGRDRRARRRHAAGDPADRRRRGGQLRLHRHARRARRSRALLGPRGGLRPAGSTATST